LFSAWLGVVLAVVLFSGGLFGYDQGVISGALTGIKSTFGRSSSRWSRPGLLWAPCSAVYVYVPETKGQSLELIWKGLTERC